MDEIGRLMDSTRGFPWPLEVLRGELHDRGHLPPGLVLPRDLVRRDWHRAVLVGADPVLTGDGAAEANGFNSGWVFDSHVLWRDPYPLLTLMAQQTMTLRLGTCVTNPATREPTVTASTLAVYPDATIALPERDFGKPFVVNRVSREY